MITKQQLSRWRKEYNLTHTNENDWEWYVSWRQHRPLFRRIIIPDFHGPNEPLYEDELGWQYEDKKEVKSSVSRVLFETYVIKWAHNFSFYYIDNDTFYGFHAQGNPIVFKKLVRDRSEPYIAWQCDGDPHYQEGEVILAEFNDTTDDYSVWRTIWNKIEIEGNKLEIVLERSYIFYNTK